MAGAVPLVFAALAQMFVVAGSQIDLGLGAFMALASVITATLLVDMTSRTGRRSSARLAQSASCDRACDHAGLRTRRDATLPVSRRGISYATVLRETVVIPSVKRMADLAAGRGG
ncbi:hypothetical protein DPM13_00680 [Paracoccus mutanolyticus]|uniref:Major facilitator superfamily (MFS) profile domain-containing protein n=1 Tax=Paracoccus mutanolyticus TaxID=1499308 RepID=A0ABM6WNV5_9RHOB|nr:hypothetical protein [Paracoccus mutanolyticus]AWX92305.1 hypothetical protein DPM13_00680 [Paracoccus mutanolyticus]